MEFRLLGSMSVTADSVAIRLGGHKEQALLAALLINADRVVSTDRLIDILWGEKVPPTATKTLRSYMSRLRSRLKAEVSPFETVSGGYLFRREGHMIDAVLFEELLAEGRTHRDRGSHPTAVALLNRGLGLWRGPPLAGLDDHEFARLEAERLEELRREAIEARIDSELRLGHHERLVAELETLVTEHPLREGLWRSLMIALYRSGRQADALRAFQRARSTLGEELGIDPSPELQDLEQAILTQSSEIALVPTKARLQVLPDPRTSFVGREDEIAGLGDLLEGHRCVTVTGTGGAGKTRLTTEAARGVMDRFENGTVFVGLASVLESASIAEHVAAALGDVGSHADDVAAALVDFLRDQNLLLVIDNCEHVVHAVAGLVDKLLSGCPHLTVLATSREPIGVRDEVVFQIPPLEVPDVDDETHDQDRSESVRLFVERARAFDRSFAITRRNRSAVVSICRSLDGIPLAIELAAARIGAMSPSEIASRMDDRFALLSTGARTAPPRHQNLRSTIDWSYDLCSEEARAALRRLSVFAGGWSLEAAEAVIADGVIERAHVAGLLADLVGRSLVDRSATEDGSRYRLLETIRQYAFDALVTTGEAPTIARRHCSFFVALAEAAEPTLKDGRQSDGLRLLEANHDNLRAAIGWSLGTEDPSGAFRLIGALGWFWFMKGHWHEAWRWVSRCIDHRGEIDPLLWSRVIYATGAIEIIRGKLDPTTELMGQARAKCHHGGDRLGEAWALHYLGHAGGWHGADDASQLMRQALDIFEELGEQWAVAWSWRYLGQDMAPVAAEEGLHLQQRALRRFFELGDRWSAAFSLYLIGATHLSSQRYDEAVEAEQHALEIATELDDVIWAAHAIGRLGIAAHYQGDGAHARQLLEDGIERHRRIGDANCVAILLGFLGLVSGSQDRWAEAVAETAESLRLWRKLGNQPAIVACLGRLAGALAGHGHLREAATLYGATQSPSAPQAILGSPIYQIERAQLEDRLKSDLGTEYDILIAEGAGMDLEQSVEIALGLASLRG